MGKGKRVRAEAQVRKRPVPKQPGVEPAGALVGVMPAGLQKIAGRKGKRRLKIMPYNYRSMPKGKDEPERIVETIRPVYADGLWCPITRDHGPTFERIAKGDLEKGWTEGKEHGNGYRRVDPLVEMERRGTISADQKRAGKRFRDLADVAMLDPLRAASYGFRIGGSRPSAHLLPGHIEDARRQIHEAMQQLGGHGTMLANCAWFVIGVGMTVRDFAARAAWASGRTLSREAVSAKVEDALSILAAWYERRRRERAAASESP